MEYAFLLMGLHMLFSLSFLVGVVLFIAWAIRELKGKKLLRVSLVLIVLGLVFGGITMGYGFRGMMTAGEWKENMMDWDGSRGRMMEGYEEIDDTPGNDEEEVVEEEETE